MSTLRRRSSFSGSTALARLPLRPRSFYADKEETPKRGGGRSPMTQPARSRTMTRELGFFMDGVQSDSLGGFSRTSQNSSCSTACETSPKTPSPKPATATALPLERKFSKGSLLEPLSPIGRSEDKTPKSVALLLAKCLQNGMDDQPNESEVVRPIQAASGLILKSPKRQTEKLALGERSHGRTLTRQKTSPPGFFRPDDLNSMSISQSSDFPAVKAFRQLEKEKIFDLYQWSEVLQEAGDGGKVVVCQPKSDYDVVPARTFVLKMRSKQSLRDNAMEEQFRKSLFTLLNMPEHAGVLPLQEVLEDQQFYYIVMEKASGGSLFSGLLKQFEDGHMPPNEVQRLLRGILEAISHIHAHGMLHRDIKPDNLVMRRGSQDEDEAETIDLDGTRNLRVAIIDFDHADPDYASKTAKLSSDQPVSDYFCGTVQFSAPEAFFGCFSPASDLYSIGIILYLLMAGNMPFENSIYKEEMSVLQQSPKSRSWTLNLYNRLKSTPIDWSCDPWPNQPQCRSFCQWLLAFEPNNRPASAAEALEHDWFATKVPAVSPVQGQGQ